MLKMTPLLTVKTGLPSPLTLRTFAPGPTMLMLFVIGGNGVNGRRMVPLMFEKTMSPPPLAEALVMAHRSVPGTIKLPKSARFVTTNVLPTETVGVCKKAAAISRLNSFGMRRLMLNGEVFIFVLSR